MLTNRHAERARARVDEIRCKSTSIKSLKMGKLNHMRDKNEGNYGGEGEGTCDHGLSRTSLRVEKEAGRGGGGHTHSLVALVI